MFEMPLKPDIHPFQRFAQHLDSALADNAERVLADLATGALTYGALAEEMSRLGAAFDVLGLKAGDRALVISRDERTVIALFFSLLRAGLTPVLGDVQTTGPELVELADVCEPAAIFADAAVMASSGIAGKIPASRLIVTDEVAGGAEFVVLKSEVVP